MKVTFLGTGTSQGVPVIACECAVCQSLDYRDKRLRSSVHIQTNTQSLIIDSGPDFRQQVLRAHIKSLDALLFTHAHKDHTAGMDDIRAYNFLHQKDIPIYAEEKVIEQLKQEFAYIFSEHKYPGIPRVATKSISNHAFQIAEDTITPIQVYHYKLPVFGFRVNDFTYITDANLIPEEEKEKIKGSRVLVLNALQIEPHISHFTLEQAIALAQELGAEQTYFTHISHKLGMHKKVEINLPQGIALAYDGLQLEL